MESLFNSTICLCQKFSKCLSIMSSCVSCLPCKFDITFSFVGCLTSQHSFCLQKWNEISHNGPVEIITRASLQIDDQFIDGWNNSETGSSQRKKRFGEPPTSTLDVERIQQSFKLSPRTHVRKNWLFQVLLMTTVFKNVCTPLETALALRWQQQVKEVCDGYSWWTIIFVQICFL